MCCSPSGRDTRSRVSFLESQECPENGKSKMITLFQKYTSGLHRTRQGGPRYLTLTKSTSRCAHSHGGCLTLGLNNISKLDVFYYRFATAFDNLSHEYIFKKLERVSL